MAEVGHITPSKPIWPEHHGEIGERGTQHKDENEAKKRQPTEEEEEPTPPGEQKRDGHIDEYA